MGRVRTHSYLGFQLDERLTFPDLIEIVSMASNQKIFWLAKIRKFLDIQTAVRLYKSIIKAKLQYGSLLYLNASLKESKRIQKLQNRALRICLMADQYTSNLIMHREAGVLPIELRRKLELYKLMYRMSRKG